MDQISKVFEVDGKVVAMLEEVSWGLLKFMVLDGTIENLQEKMRDLGDTYPNELNTELNGWLVYLISKPYNFNCVRHDFLRIIEGWLEGVKLWTFRKV